MAYEKKIIDQAQIQVQRDICAQIAQRFQAQGRQPLALVDTYGCQQNEADSEELRGYLKLMGCGFTQDEFEACLLYTI